MNLLLKSLHMLHRKGQAWELNDQWLKLFPVCIVHWAYFKKDTILAMKKSVLVLGLMAVITGCVRDAEVPLSDLNGDFTTTEGDKYTLFLPATEPLKPIGFMFYPGGLVASEGYFEMLTPIAEAGYAVVVVDMPRQLAVFSPKRGAKVLSELEAGPNRWVIGGHSLGGSMAARQVEDDPALFEGLIFMASYPASGDDLSEVDIAVLSLYGSEDALATPEDIYDREALLPSDTQYIEITGGNHAQFGSYGEQDEEDIATITKEEQHMIIQQEVMAFLRGLE